MQEKLFYEDAYLTSFQAKILKQDQDQTGKSFVVLDKTAFYPTGGGQPFDTGYINDKKVENVEEIDGEIRHYLSELLPDISASINGTIDWNRRFDHMQQHLGQHILSAAFEELFGYETIGFHLGSDEVTIDLNTDQLSDDQAWTAEQRANQIILKNRPVETKWVNSEEARQFPLRKELSVMENIRLVIIPDFDYNGCGGTHPKHTSEVGSLKILGWERQKKKVRVTFVCGNRVLKQLGRKQNILKQLSPLLNSPEENIVQTVTKVLETMKEQDKELETAYDSILEYEGKALLQKKFLISGNKVIAEVLTKRTIQDLQKIARFLITISPSIITILVSENEQRLQVVCAHGDEVNANMKKLISELLPMINGKGGGSATFAQGGGDTTMTGKQLIDQATKLLSEN